MAVAVMMKKQRMSKEDARAILRREGYCDTHGCKLVESKAEKNNFRPINIHGTEKHCPECRREAEEARKTEIAEAKRVLGL